MRNGPVPDVTESTSVNGVPLRGLTGSVGVSAAASFGWLLWPGEVTRALALVTLVLVARDTAVVVASRRRYGPPQRRRLPRRDSGHPAMWIFRGESPPDSIFLRVDLIAPITPPALPEETTDDGR
jgi:hypothetical protein